MANPEKDPVETLVHYGFIYSTFFGLSNHFYDFKLHKLVHCPKAVTYCTILDLSMAIFLPFALWQDFGFSDVEMFIKRPIAKQLNKALTILNTLAIGVSLLSLWINRSYGKSIFNDLNNILHHELTGLKKNVDTQQYAKIALSIKFSSSIIMVFGTFSTMYFQQENPSTSYILTAVYISIMENVLTTVENQFFMGIIYEGYLFKVLNFHLSQVITKMNLLCQNGQRHISMQKSRFFSNELAKIGRIHTSLHKLALGIKDLYQFQILVILVTVFVTQVTVLYSFCVQLSGVSLGVKGFEFLVVTGAVVLSILDLWLLVHACGDLVTECNKAGEIVKVLSAQSISNAPLERSIEMLSFQLMREKMHLTICGMFDLGWQTGFILTQASVMKLILLLQIDYKNF